MIDRLLVTRQARHGLFRIGRCAEHLRRPHKQCMVIRSRYQHLRTSPMRRGLRIPLLRYRLGHRMQVGIVLLDESSRVRALHVKRTRPQHILGG